MSDRSGHESGAKSQNPPLDGSSASSDRNCVRGGLSLPRNVPALPDEVKSVLGAIDKQVKHIRQDILQTFDKLDVKEELARLPPLKRAKFGVSMGYAINALFYNFLKTRGVSASAHPCKKEIDRIRAYNKKLQAVKKKLQECQQDTGSTDTAGENVEAKLPKKKQIDASALKRTIMRTHKDNMRRKKRKKKH